MNNEYKLKLLSKRLKSGKCQIKFYFSSAQETNMYGYVLADSQTTLKEVVGLIQNKVMALDSPANFYQSHLYNLASRQKNEDRILVFNN